MEYAIIYKITRTRKNLYITPKTFSLCENLGNNKLKVLSNDFENLIATNVSSEFNVKDEEQFVAVTLPQEYVYSLYNTYDVNEVKEIIEATPQVLKVKNGEIIEASPSNFILDVIKSNI